MGLFFNARFTDAFVNVVRERKLLPLLFRRNCKKNDGDSSNCDHIYGGKNG